MNYITSIQNTSKDPDHLYYNINIANDESIDADNSPAIKYIDSRDSPILEDISDWYFSIIRFQLRAIQSPLFIPQIEKDQSNPNKTIYKISLVYHYSYNNGIYQPVIKSRNIEYRPQNTSLNNQSSTDEYYYIYQYSHFIKLVNETFQLIHTDIHNQIKTNHSNNNITLSFKAPVLRYDNNTQMFQLYLDKNVYNRKEKNFNSTPSYNIDVKGFLFFNSNMYNLFGNFHCNKIGNDITNSFWYYQNNTHTDENKRYLTNQNGMNYEIMPIEDGLNLNEVVISNKTYYKMEQDFESTSELWNPISSIVFTTNILPVVGEISGNPLVFQDGKSSTQSNRNITEKILTDFQMPLTSADNYQNAITYSPSEYRVSDFFGTKFTLRSLDINAYWKNRLTGKMMPLKLKNKGSIDLKIMFKKKV